VSKCSGFEFSEYGSQSARNWNSANSRWVVFAVLNLQKDAFSVRIFPSAPEDHILSQKLLRDVSVCMFATENRPSAA
jgi:hypothetical protein